MCRKKNNGTKFLQSRLAGHQPLRTTMKKTVKSNPKIQRANCIFISTTAIPSHACTFIGICILQSIKSGKLAFGAQAHQFPFWIVVCADPVRGWPGNVFGILQCHSDSQMFKMFANTLQILWVRYDITSSLVEHNRHFSTVDLLKFLLPTVWCFVSKNLSVTTMLANDTFHVQSDHCWQVCRRLILQNNSPLQPAHDEDADTLEIALRSALKFLSHMGIGKVGIVYVPIGIYIYKLSTTLG